MDGDGASDDDDDAASSLLGHGRTRKSEATATTENAKNTMLWVVAATPV